MEIPHGVLPDTSVALCYEVLVSSDGASITLMMATTQLTAICPLCQQTSTKVHSQYCRTLADLPWAGIAVHIQLSTRRFVCGNSECKRSIFTERLPELAAPWARRTNRLVTLQQQIALTAGGVGGSKLCAQLGMEASVDVLLCLSRQVVPPSAPAPRVIGVDDWAKRKGQSYGTIIVDHETGQVIDLLPDRTPATLATWLRNHPGIEVVSRDRAEAYAQGIRDGAPDALQVADRWHLLKNLTDTLVKELQHHHIALQQRRAPQLPAGQGATPNDDVAALPESTAPSPAPAQAPASTLCDQRRQARAEKAHELNQQGWTQKDIAAHLNINPKTVGRDLQRSLPLPPRGTQRHSLLMPFTTYLTVHWQAGCQNATQLFREIQPQGYAGQITIVRDFLRQLKHTGTSSIAAGAVITGTDPAQRPPSIRTLAWLITQRPEALSETQTQSLAQIHNVSSRLEETITLAQEFARLIRQQGASDFDGWLERADCAASGLLKSFAHGLRQDYAAVRAAMTQIWSNGRTEGHVNRLKCLKRQMYGRAKLDLLRRRLVAT